MEVKFRWKGGIPLVGWNGWCWRAEVEQMENDWRALTVAERVSPKPRDGWSWFHHYPASYSVKPGLKLWVRPRISEPVDRYEVGGDEEWVWEARFHPIDRQEVWIEQVHRQAGVIGSVIILGRKGKVQGVLRGGLEKVPGLNVGEVKALWATLLLGGA